MSTFAEGITPRMAGPTAAMMSAMAWGLLPNRSLWSGSG